MVICPIARAVHCTGCPFVQFCPAKTILGDYGKDDSVTAKNQGEPEQPMIAKESGDSNA
jgi:hypothetical protein